MVALIFWFFWIKPKEQENKPIIQINCIFVKQFNCYPLGDPDQQALLRQDALHLFGPPRLHERRGDMRDRFRTLDLYFEEYGDTTENAVQGTQVRPRRTRTAERARRLLQGGPRALRREREDLSGQSRHRAMGT